MNVIVIGATNREDLIDPAILRPGQRREDQDRTAEMAVAATQIFARYLTTEIPLSALEIAPWDGDGEVAVAKMIDATVAEMYREDESNRFLEVTYQNGDKEILYKDLLVGRDDREHRAPGEEAHQAVIAGGERGIRTQDLLDSIKQEYKEHEDLPNTTNPDDWAKISGKKGGAHRVHPDPGQRHQASTSPVASHRTVLGTGQYL